MNIHAQPRADSPPDTRGPLPPPARRVLLVAPVPPPYGGMALQAKLLERLLREDGAEVDLVGHNQPFARLNWLERLPGLRTPIRATIFCRRVWKHAGDADVVHILAASWLHFVLVVSPTILLSRVRRKRVVLNYRAGDADRFLKWCSWLVKPLFRMAHAVTAPSRFLAEVIHSRVGLPVSIVPNIVNLSAFRFRERHAFQPRMLVTRHLEKLYDVESILRAFRHVQRTYPTASLWIAGTGSEERRLRELVAAWALQNVRFLGHVDHGHLPSVYDQCDILLNASRIDNFPGSLLEASAAGLVVISTNAGGIPFIYEPGENALLVEVGQWKDLGFAVERVIQDRALGHKLAAGGVELCRKFQWRSIRDALYAVYGFNQSNPIQARSIGVYMDPSLECQPLTHSAEEGT